MTTARSAPRSRTTVSRYRWAVEDPVRIGVTVDSRRLPDDDPGFDDHVNDLIDTITTCQAGESFLLWTKYRALAAIHDQIAAGTGDDEARLVSEHSGVAARYAVTGAISQHVAAKHVNEAVAMVHRLPRTGERLRDGVLAPWQFTRIVSRSDLIDGEGYRVELDEETCAERAQRVEVSPAASLTDRGRVNAWMRWSIRSSSGTTPMRCAAATKTRNKHGR